MHSLTVELSRTGEVLRNLGAALTKDFSGVAPLTYVLPDFEAKRADWSSLARVAAFALCGLVIPRLDRQACICKSTETSTG